MSGIFFKSSKLKKNDVETQVKSILSNYESSQDDDMACDNISIFEDNTENIDLDSNIVSAVLVKRKTFSDLPDELHQWVVESGVTQNADDSLLKIFTKRPLTPKMFTDFDENITFM